MYIFKSLSFQHGKEREALKVLENIHKTNHRRKPGNYPDFGVGI
jgi:hypothetical protein